LPLRVTISGSGNDAFIAVIYQAIGVE